MVRHPPTLVGRRFRGADVETAVDLESVGVDDLSAGGFGERHRQGALARSGRTDDGEHTWHEEP
jgi:hypothetical protein